ncbi:MAG TPA: Xaa-Pro peptidase family protein [Phycisphaerae bacterium]|nr:Xaa-Pro peptidase family protein [Phycisphaerae bacterium]
MTTRTGKQPTARRIAALRAVCRDEKVHAVLLTDPSNVRYYSGFTGEDSYLLVGPRWARLLTDSRFAVQAKIDCPHIGAVIRTGRMTEAIREALAGRGVRVLGIEGAAMTVAGRDALAKALKKVRLKALGPAVSDARQCKDKAELAAIRRAVRAAERGMKDLLAGGRKKFIGRSEREVAAELEYRMRLHGAQKASFETIVAAGSHAALPHYRPGGTRIRAEEAVLIDWGAVVDGYCSDLTRVVFTGKIRDPIAGVYEIVLCAQAAGIAAVAPEATCASADAAARAVIEAAGYGKAFGHGLGHGLGLQVHEPPHLARGMDRKLRAGMVVTVEPGIYLPGVGGVRIEDDVLVVPGGRRRLSSLPRDLRAMVLA